MKYLIMCEGPNELEVVRMLLEHDKLIFTKDDLLNLVPYHARQITKSAAVKNALNLYSGEVHVLRIGDTLGDELKIPKDYKQQITKISKYCTKPELEMLLIISENKQLDFEKHKISKSPKMFAKENIIYNRVRYNNSTIFYRQYYDGRIDLLIKTIKKYKQIKKHKKNENYLADLLKWCFIFDKNELLTGLVIRKVDSVTKQPLANAKFTISGHLNDGSTFGPTEYYADANCLITIEDIKSVH